MLAAATAACGDGGENATDARASAAAAAARAGPLRALFSGLTHELDLLRLSSPTNLEGFSASRLLSAENQRDVTDDVKDAGAGFVVDALDEAAASLAARLSGSSSCFAGAGGVVTRTLRALGVLAEDLEAVVARLRERSADELKRCGLGALALDANENENENENENDAIETAADVATLTFFAARAEACRRRGLLRSEADLADAFGTNTNTGSSTETRTRDDRMRRLGARVLASHLALADATRFETRAAEIGRKDETGVSVSTVSVSTVSGSGTCLGDAFPPPDPRWDAPAGASLLTSTHALAFVVAALRDVTLSESTCARALDAPPGVLFASPALDAVAQEAAEAGVFPAAAAWLAAAPAGSAGLEASMDEVQAAARACAVANRGSEANAANATVDPRGSAWIRVERGPTDAALEFLRRLEAATLGRRGGCRGYSAVGKLVNALETLVRDLERGGCLERLEPSRSGEERKSNSRESGSVSVASAQTTGRSRTAADPLPRDRADDAAAVARKRRDGVEILAEDRRRGGSQGDSTRTSAPSITSDLILGVLFGVAAFALVAAAAGAVTARRGARSAARKRRVSGSSPADDRSAVGADRLGSDRSSLLGGGATGSARRFYRHLEAGSAGDLPLVEDLDRAASATQSGGPRSESPRPSTPPSTPYASQFFAPTSRRRSHSISVPAAVRAPLPPRHERRHTTRAEDV